MSHPTVDADERFAIVPDWVICHERLPAGAVRVYAHLSRRADAKGASYPGVRSIAKAVHASTSSVTAWLEQLEQVGALQVIHGQANRRGLRREGNRYQVNRVNPERAGEQNVPMIATFAHRDVERRDSRPSNVAVSATEVDPVKKTHSSRPNSFDEFWSAYPRKVGKGAARKAWVKATRRAEPLTILEGARRYALDRDGEDAKFTAHAATWLGADRWEDEPDPPKQPARPKSFGVLEAAAKELNRGEG